MVTALYRRYRPETFAELIGQSQVTEPLMTALRTNRVNHAYLFSGPRGCGKTTSARILARCLNCVEGPTDTPCGKCASCRELARDGGGSLDVVEIDAASHNGVDDARDLRERAVFAPARDRYKIFILDEAHMVTPQGFNALLKIVEEPPDHVKFIFATTEPDKVIGTIRSRTHHYPFRLVPPAQMLEYAQSMCDSEKVTVEPGVLPLVVRAGGGSVRDTLSLLDQLMAGSEGNSIEYELAVVLLGYTHSALLGEVIDAIGSRDAAAAFSAVDRVIQTGQDPRRFVEDLLERLRDLIVVAATGGGAAAVLRGIQQDELDQMTVQASRFGEAELSRAADVVGAALTEMTGATSPRLHLELMIARILVPTSDASARGTLSRVERLERRVGVEQPPLPEGSRSDRLEEGKSEPQGPSGVDRDASSLPAPESPLPEALEGEREPEMEKPLPEGSRSDRLEGSTPAAPSTTTAPSTPAAPSTPVTFQQLVDSWAEILEVVGKTKRAAWAVAFTARPMGLKDDVLALAFPSQNDVENFKKPQAADQSVSEILRHAIIEVLGIRVKFIAKPDAAAAASRPKVSPAEPAQEPAAPTTTESSTDSGGWAVAAIPQGDTAPTPDVETARKPAPKAGAKQGPNPDAKAKPAAKAKPDADATPKPVSKDESPAKSTSKPETPDAAPKTAPPSGSRSESGAKQRYGEAVVREILGANFIEEKTVAPRVTPTQEG
ncbi:MAG: DNA polymerase III subunit gamma and tau [Micrococcales bacterium]|nr:DNA polymerase III subunit gamma and tau [Micrococcales bacterium]